LNIDAFRKAFRAVYPESGEPFICRAPGRVNLIGEHMDYNGLPVLPMAIGQSIQIAFAPRKEPLVTMRNVTDRFPAVSFDNSAAIPPSPPGSWENYCKAAIQKLNNHLEVHEFRGMDMLIDSDLPMAAGLSSSSSLVVASALAYLGTLDLRLDQDMSRVELADLMATAEHYVGTRGGGMDQAVILNGMAGHACKIDFFPLRVETAPLPKGFAVVVTDSMVKVEKSGAALHLFNAGPRYCQLATVLVDRQLKAEFDEEVSIDRLGDMWFGPLCLTHEEAKSICDRAIPEETLSLEQISQLLNVDKHTVRESWLGDQPEPENGFPLKARLRHQLSEYRRVELARDALLVGDADELGRLMNDSHTSCAEDFGISSEELDALVETSRNAGALGARLTGAGFGGATISLVPEEHLADFTEHVTTHYYKKRRGLKDSPPLFTAVASAGAEYV